MKIIFLGAPGAGKGTQAENVSNLYNIPAISTGAIIRESIKAGTEAGLRAKQFTDKGQLVPDEAVIAIIKERLALDDCKEGFILDGFPRTLAQAEALDKLGIEIDFAVTIEVEDQAIIERMSGRRVCGKCGASYHVLYNPPAKEGVCDKCGEKLTIRDDDRPEVVADRLKVYHELTEPLKKFYDDKGRFQTVIGQVEVKDTTALTLKAIEAGIAAAKGNK
ncbi:MAG: adenylate kinase [Kiritimatiellae bacterium]|nr:adenylate kinase [Kiritimatiellia bacterium]